MSFPGYVLVQPRLVAEDQWHPIAFVSYRWGIQFGRRGLAFVEYFRKERGEQIDQNEKKNQARSLLRNRCMSLFIHRRQSSVIGIFWRAASSRIAFQSESGMKIEICLRSSLLGFSILRTSILRREKSENQRVLELQVRLVYEKIAFPKTWAG